MRIPDEIIFKAQDAHMHELYHGRVSTDDDDSTKSYRAQVKGFEVIAEWAMRESAAQACGGCRAGDPIPTTEHQNMDSMGFYPCKAIGILAMIDGK